MEEIASLSCSTVVSTDGTVMATVPSPATLLFRFKVTSHAAGACVGMRVFCDYHYYTHNIQVPLPPVPVGYHT